MLLKLIDLVILTLEGEKLSFDEMQFAYQAKDSTTMCSWTVTSVVDHVIPGGMPVYGAAMDGYVQSFRHGGVGCSVQNIDGEASGSHLLEACSSTGTSSVIIK